MSLMNSPVQASNKVPVVTPPREQEEPKQATNDHEKGSDSSDSSEDDYFEFLEDVPNEDTSQEMEMDMDFKKWMQKRGAKGECELDERSMSTEELLRRDEELIRKGKKLARQSEELERRSEERKSVMEQLGREVDKLAAKNRKWDEDHDRAEENKSDDRKDTFERIERLEKRMHEDREEFHFFHGLCTNTLTGQQIEAFEEMLRKGRIDSAREAEDGAPSRAHKRAK